MKKHIILTSLFAIAATCGAANAETDVTFAGNYTATTGIQPVSAGTPGAYSFTYSGTAVDGSVVENIASDTGAGVAKNQFNYSLADGTAADLSDNMSYVATDYVAGTAASGYTNVHVEDGYGLDAASSVVDSNYSYVNPQYDASDESSQQYIVLDKDGTARTLHTNYATNETYTSGSADITTATTATDLIDLYSYQSEGSHLYKLSEDGTGVRDITNDGQAVDLDNPAIDPVLRGLLQGMIDAYAADSGDAFTTALDALNVLQTQENNNFDDALDAYNADVATQGTLVTNFGTYTTAVNAYGEETAANSNYQIALDNYNADTAKFNSASALYNSSIETTLDGTLTSAREYADSQDITTLTSAKDYADSLADNYDAAGSAETAEANAKDYSDANLVAAKSYADEKDDLTLASAQDYSDANLSIAKNYTDDQIEVAMNNMFDYADTRDALVLNQANAYTDKRIEKLDKDLSAGIASSAALSSVAVSGVKKGELSFGAGFGHHNSQSAAAFGAVMGLSDSWSVNAGAGFSNSNVTVRAGTNYKFKLF